jgi:hypothetical protein
VVVTDRRTTTRCVVVTVVTVTAPLWGSGGQAPKCPNGLGDGNPSYPTRAEVLGFGVHAGPEFPWSRLHRRCDSARKSLSLLDESDRATRAQRGEREETQRSLETTRMKHGSHRSYAEQIQNESTVDDARAKCKANARAWVGRSALSQIRVQHWWYE